MATVDELVIQIKADVKDLKKKMKDVNGELDKVGKKGSRGLNKTTKASRGLGVAMLGLKASAVAVVGALAGIAKVGGTIARVGAQFEDLKDSLDTVFGSIEEGDVAMDKVFQFAQTTPFQIETATKAFIALKSAGIEPSMEMLQTFADTASVSTDQLGTFEALIRTVQRSASGGMGLEELNMIADRGIDVLGIFKKELNLGKDDIAKFGKTSQGAELMVKALIKGLQEKFGGAMETKMDNLSTKTSNMEIAFKQLGDTIFQMGLGEFLKEQADGLTAMANAIGDFLARTSGLKGIDLIEDVEGQGERVTERNRAANITLLDEEIKRLQELTIQNKKTLDSTKAFNEERGVDSIASRMQIEQLEEQIARGKSLILVEMSRKKTLEALNGTLKDNNEETSKATDLNKEQTAFFNQFGKLLSDTVKPLDEVQQQIKMLNELMAEGVVDAEGNPLIDPDEGEKVLAHLQGLEKELQEVEGAMELISDAVIQSSMAFSKDFADALLDGENALESFRDFSKNIVSQIIAIFLQMAFINKILNVVFAGQIKAGNMDRFSTFEFGANKAGGGTVQPRTPVLVGERGPEIFVPNTGGTVMNNMNSKNAMGGGGDIIINQNLNFSTGVQSTVRSEVLKLLPTISEVTKASVMDSASRGGNFAKAVRG
jgi:hypothetical protein